MAERVSPIPPTPLHPDLLSSGSMPAVPRVATPPGAGVDALALELAEERTRRETVEADLRRMRFVADVMSRMTTTADYGERIAALARAIVPELGDWCAIDVVDGGTPDAPTFRRIAVEHFSGDPARVELVRDIERRWPQDPASPTSRVAALRRRQPVWIPEVTDEMLLAAARDAEHARVVRQLGLRSMVVAPLLAGERPLGALTLATAESGRLYTASDVALVADLAERVSNLIEFARLHLEVVEQKAQLGRQAVELEMQAAELQSTLAELEVSNVTLQEQAVEVETANHHLQEVQLELEVQADELTHANDALAQLALDLEAQRGTAEEAREVAQAANRAKVDFLARMSHELRTPLNAIAGYLDILDMEVRGPLTDAQREDLARVRRAQRQIVTIIGDILNFARLEQGKLEVHVRPVAVCDVLEELSAVMEPLVALRGLAWRCERGTPGLVVLADPERLNQVLLNLAQNASKFTEAGEVQVTAERRGDAVAILVRDTGRGIPPERLASIWEPFVQVDRQRTARADQGLGLGLPISRELARAMGGELTVESEPGEGSTFTLVLQSGNTGPEQPGIDTRVSGQDA